MKCTTIAIVDDEQMVVAMLNVWLGNLPDYKVVGRAYNGNDGLALCRETKPDIVLLDIEMPGMDGLATAHELRLSVPDTRIIVLTSHIEPYCIYQVSRLGVQGYVNKTEPLSVLRDAIAQVAAGKHYYAPVYHMVRDTKLSGPDAFHKILTPQQMAVLLLLIRGHDDEAIAAELHVTAATVATHRRNLRTKTGAHNDRDLIRYARQWGLALM